MLRRPDPPAADPLSGRTTRRSRWRLPSIIVGLAILVAVGSYVYTTQTAPQLQSGRARAGGDGPTPVLVAAAKNADVPVYLDGVGTTKALNIVTVRPQIDGKLASVNFKEGQDVEKGFVLAEIDPVIYQAQYDQAVAKKAQDQATLGNARVDLERYIRLSQSNSGSKQQADTQAALVTQLEAQVRADQGAIDNAKGYLDYTKVTAPLAGRTGIRQVDAGNIVHASDATGIVVITQLKPISIQFTLPQQQVARVNQAFAQGALAVDAIGADNKSIVDSGSLQVVDNQVDPTTGTVKLKAEFPNATLQLWPGQFINVRLLIETLKQVVVVPTAAIQRGPNGTFVYVLQDTGDKVAMRPVRVRQQDETQAVVATGLQPGERVVTTGFTRLSDGAAITVSGGDNTSPPAAGGRPRGQPAGAAGQGNGEPRSGGQRRNQQGAGGNAGPPQ